MNLRGEGSRSPTAFPNIPVTGYSLPGVQVSEDEVDNLPNMPLQPQFDVKTVHVAEPLGPSGAGRLHFTIRTAGGPVVPDGQ